MSNRADSASIHALLVYSLPEGRLVEQRIFDESKYPDPDLRSEKATDAYFEAEKAHRDSDGVEIVLLASDSLESIQATHSSYFLGTVPKRAEYGTLEELLQALKDQVESKGV